MKEWKRFSGDGNDAGQWMPLFPNMCSAGEGVLPLAKILKTASENGVVHFFVEQDLVANPEAALKKSIDFLKGI
jgi:sugar phosphate isomerase/epimerase